MKVEKIGGVTWLNAMEMDFAYTHSGDIEVDWLEVGRVYLNVADISRVLGEVDGYCRIFHKGIERATRIDGTAEEVLQLLRAAESA
ncbi:MAG: hypothetical protein GY832_22190 [Chloroflexi bacterium]|nr:hypothetical protein [Chloroflexota bacterium]